MAPLLYMNSWSLPPLKCHHQDPLLQHVYHMLPVMQLQKLPLFTSPISAPPTVEAASSKIVPISRGNQNPEPSDVQDSNTKKHNLASDDNVDQSQWLNFTQTDYNTGRQLPFCEDILDEAILERTSGRYM